MDMTREELLQRIYEVGFAGVDLNLFLDNHPTDQNALMAYNSIVQELQSLMNTYETKFGPLMNLGMSQSGYPWGWVEEPWPWERDF